MSSILVVTYVVNLLVVNYMFGIIGAIITILISGAIYYFVSKDAGDKRRHWGQLLAMIFGHLAGIFAVMNAPWSTSLIVSAVVVLEVLMIGIFSSMGRA